MITIAAWIGVAVSICLSFQAVAAPPDITLTGIVLDSATREPVIGAQILLQELNKRDVTHKDGSFHLRGLSAGSYTLYIRQLGYAPRTIRCTLSGDSALTIWLGMLSYRMQTTSVQAERTQATLSGTRPVTEVPLAELDKHRGQTLANAIENLPGISLLQTGPSIAKPVIRGLHSSRVAVVNGGIQQEGQQWGAEHAPEIDPFAPAKIEVLKGAAGVEYGAGALGGVIRIAPHALHFDMPIGAEFSSNGFSNNQQGAFSLALNGGSLPLLDKGGWRTQLSWRKAGDSYTPGYLLSNTGFQELNASVAVGTGGEDYGIESSYSYFSTELGILSASHIGNINDLNRALQSGTPLIVRDFGYTIRPPKQEIAHHTLSVKGYFSSALGKWEAQYGWQLNMREEFDAHNSRIRDSSALQSYLSRPALGLSLATYTLDLKLHHHEIGRLSGVFGMGAIRQHNVRTGRVLLIPDYTAYTVGAFLVENYTLEDWSFNVGMRADQRWMSVIPIDKARATLLPDTLFHFGGFTAAIGVMRQLTQRLSLSLNMTSGWRPPNVNELYSNDVHHGTAQFEIGDKGLRSERSLSFDATLNMNLPALRGEISLYTNAIGNYIFLQPDKENPTVTIRGVFPTMYYRQTDAFLYGAEARCEFPLLEWCNAALNYSAVRGDDSQNNQPLIFMPADRLRSTLHLHSEELWGMEKPYIEASLLSVARQSRFPTGVDYVDPPPGYTLFDMAAGASMHILGIECVLNMEIRNIANTSYRDYLSRYRYFALDPGRNFILRLRIPLGSTLSEDV